MLGAVDRTMGSYHLMADPSDQVTACGVWWDWRRLERGHSEQRVSSDGKLVYYLLTSEGIPADCCPRCLGLWKEQRS